MPTTMKGTITHLNFGGCELKIIQDRCGVVAEHGINECNISAVYSDIDTHFVHFLTFLSEGHKRDYESCNPQLKLQWSSSMISPSVSTEDIWKTNWPYPYAMGTTNNPWDENSYYHCGTCGLEWTGQEVGYIAAGTNYANGEFAPCPKCEEENIIVRCDDDS